MCCFTFHFPSSNRTMLGPNSLFLYRYCRLCLASLLLCSHEYLTFDTRFRNEAHFSFVVVLPLPAIAVVLLAK
ncbi:hypothetical protein BDB00DRAFT_864561, partial [Zychaea mexicana]|uniref:uncharacterized protein n=1 Tax=Zychaea mexicana TaxID=64656 RepID=UPI0022FE3E08